MEDSFRALKRYHTLRSEQDSALLKVVQKSKARSGFKALKFYAINQSTKRLVFKELQRHAALSLAIKNLQRRRATRIALLVVK